MPGDPLALCAYLTERAESGRAMGTLDLSCTAIRHVDRMCGAEDPVDHEAVRQVRLGLRRTYGSAPRRLARALTVAEIRQIVAGIDRSTPIGTRDAAIILLGFASAMRRSEIVALTLADVEHKPAGLLLNVRQFKTDQQGHGQVVAVAHGQHALTDLVAALAHWRAVPPCAGESVRAGIVAGIVAALDSLLSVGGIVLSLLARPAPDSLAADLAARHDRRAARSRAPFERFTAG